MQSSLLNATLDDKNIYEIPQFRCGVLNLLHHTCCSALKNLDTHRIDYWHMCRLLLKQLVTMEVIQWTSLWSTFKDEFENEKNMLGGSLSEKAAEDLKQRIIEHVTF